MAACIRVAWVWFFFRPPSLCVTFRWLGRLGVSQDGPCQLHGSWLPIVRAETQRQGGATLNFTPQRKLQTKKGLLCRGPGVCLQ